MLESCIATVKIVAVERKKWIDSTNIQRDSTKILKRNLAKMTKKKGFWKKTAIISVIITTLSIIL
jgi:hypothetical protein